MEKKDFSSLLRYPLIVIAVAILGLVVGAFADLSLSESLFRGQSTILRLASCLTPLVGLFVISISAILLFLYYRHSRNSNKRNLSFLAFLIIILGGVFYGLGPLSSFSFSTIISIILGIALGAVFALIAYFLFRKEDPHDFGKVGYVYLLSTLLVFGFSFFLESVVARPSYNMLLLTDEAGTDYLSFFKAWYVFNTDKTSFPDSVSSSYYASFPSLSASLSSLGLLLPMGCPLHKKTEKWAPLSFWIAFALVLVDGLLLIIQGRAFLSDVSCSLLIGSFPLFIACALSKENEEVSLALAANKARRRKRLRDSLHSPKVYGVGARRLYERQVPPLTRMNIRFKNNRKKSKKESKGPFFKLDKNRR